MEGEDFVGISKEIILNADIPYKNVYIPIINDECLEYDEYLKKMIVSYLGLDM